MKKFVTVLIGVLFSLPVVAADDFPGRKLYEDVKVVSVDELAKIRKDAHVVDVRTPYEYETIHIAGAINIPISKGDFVKDVSALRAKDEKPIVFYCNGHTCYKSYQAARKAQVYGVKGCYSFDAGIFDWANARPEDAVLLGKSPVDKSKLISKKAHKEHVISAADFEAKVKSGNYYVLDVRSAIQRSAMGLFPFTEKWASLDDRDKIKAAVDDAKAQKKALLIYDNVGHQVSWLEYRLREMGVTDYQFMEGGAESYFKHMESKPNAVRIPTDLLTVKH